MSSLELPPDQRPAVIVHVGMGKTGTTTIQATFHRNRRRLARQGILYPKSPGKRRHIRLGLAMQPDDGVPRQSVGWRWQAESTPGELRPVIEEALFAELQRGPRLVLVSDEGLFAATDDGIVNLRELLDRIAASVRVVAYLRRQDDHLCSRYQQVVKREEEVRRLTERARDDFSPVYDFHARLTAWRDLMRPDELVVRTFEPHLFVGGSLLSDFVDASGLDLQPDTLTQLQPKNESMDAESVEFLRILNLHLRQLGVRPDRKQTNDVIRLLRPHTSGLALTLPEPALDQFMDQWQASNDAVARDFVAAPRDSLFSSGRRSGRTTTEQGLDPARFAQLLYLVELPAPWRGPLQRIAEQQAEEAPHP